LKTEEALAHRKVVEQEIAEMRKQGITPDLPIDFDDLDEPSRAEPSPMDSMPPSKLNAIRANLSSSWILAQQLEAEAREEASERDRAYLAEREHAHLVPDKPKTRKRKR
jgi:hypothetical protein